MPDADSLVDMVTGFGNRDDRVVHIQRIPARPETISDWPEWLPDPVHEAFAKRGIERPWTHQAITADLARAGRDVVLATGTASGKSLGYLMPALTSILEGLDAADGRGATVIYLTPTKALAADQLFAVEGLAVRGVRAGRLDGDTPREEREWVRRHANYILTNPDMLHRSILPGHPRWQALLRRCRVIVVDEAHSYRGVFGAHVAMVLRRLLRVIHHYGGEPVVIGASATMSDPAESFARLTGREATAVTEDGSPSRAGAFVLWEPPQLPGVGENGAPNRRGVIGESATILSDAVAAGLRSLAFIRSRRGAEAISDMTRRLLADVDDALVRRVATYRGGYLPEERRRLEEALRAGTLLGVASTNALELGIDISGLDVVIIGGWPGTRASLWQQAGRAGRAGSDWVAVLVARDDPLDTFLVHHPEAIFDAPIEANVFDPSNPYVLSGHLCAAAEELPLTEDDLPLFGEHTAALVERLVERGMLRRRPRGWFWTKREHAAALTDIRGEGGRTFRVVDHASGVLIGTVDSGAAFAQMHDGAVYVHQGATFLVDELDLEGSTALVSPAIPDYTTQARAVTDIRILDREWTRPWVDGIGLHFGAVEVSEQIVSYQRRQLVTGIVLGEQELELPAQDLPTKAVWWTLPKPLLEAAGIAPGDVPGAVHAAEHAAIGILPLFATCDRWDIGGVSTAAHADTGQATIFVYDGTAGGAGFSERGASRAREWLTATADAIEACECAEGCPSCVQSPKCGNGNEPLDKAKALALLRAMLG